MALASSFYEEIYFVPIIAAQFTSNHISIRGIICVNAPVFSRRYIVKISRGINI